MSEAQTATQAAATETTEGVSFLDQVVAATKQTAPDQAQDLVKNLVEQALAGTVTFDKNLTRTFDRAIAAIDAKLSAQLNAIMHHPKFTQLEGSWRGLHYLVMNSETSTTLKLRLVSNVAAAAFAPFISAAGAGMFGFDNWPELAKPRDLAKIFESQDYVKWRSFRDSEDSRFVSLVLPRTLARLPYGAATKAIDEFAYEEAPYDEAGAAKSMQHGEYCWMNAAYAMGARLTDAFAQYGFCTAIRGAEGGGKVENLPYHVFTSDDGDLDAKCPTEIAITDRREFELSNLGFLPLCHYKNTDYSVFFGAQTTQKPKKYDRPAATANAAISARLPYMMASSRFAHYLKVMARDKIGSFMEAGDCERWLNRWIMNYVNGNENAGQEMKARFPLREAKVEVREIPGKPGSYNAVAYLRPWLQMEELTTSLRMVARIPAATG